MKNNNLITAILLAIVVGALSFFGGMKYQQSQTVNFRNNGQFNFRGQTGMMGNAQRTGTQRMRNGFGGGTIGEILSIDANSISVKLPDGSSKIVNMSTTTTIAKTATATKSELKTGENIMAFGEVNSDGSITATRIQLNPPQMNRPSISPAQ
jgi:preprotein translocase subunit YajC